MHPVSCHAAHLLPSPEPTTLPTDLGHSNQGGATQWIRQPVPTQSSSTCLYATEVRREPPQAVTGGGHPSVEIYHADNVRTEWTDDGIELLVLVYDNPDAVRIIEAHEQ